MKVVRVAMGTSTIKLILRVHCIKLNTPHGPLNLFIESPEGTNQDCFLPGMVDALGSKVKRVGPVKLPVSDATWMVVPESGVPPVKPCLLLSSPVPFRLVIERNGVDWKQRVDDETKHQTQPNNRSQKGTGDELEDG